MGRTYMLSRWMDEYSTSFVGEVSDVQLSYLAGVIDGEGFFQVSGKTNTFGLGVSVTDRCLIEWLLKTFGGRAYFDVQQTTGNRLVHRWFLSRHADLAFLLPRLMPFLVIKRRQAARMVRLVEHLQNPPHYHVPTSRSSQAVRALRRELRQRWKDQGVSLRLAVREARYLTDSRPADLAK